MVLRVRETDIEVWWALMPGWPPAGAQRCARRRVGHRGAQRDRAQVQVRTERRVASMGRVADGKIWVAAGERAQGRSAASGIPA